MTHPAVPPVSVHPRRWLSRWCAIAVLCLTGAACDRATGPGEPIAERSPADLILVNGHVYVMDAADTRVEAVAIRAGAIIATGTTNALLAAYTGPVRDLAGQMVLPGFHDAHAHPLEGGLQSRQCDLAAAASVAALLEQVRTCAAALPPDAWLLGGGWNLALFPAANADKALLDDISRERPIFLLGADYHSAWANSAALAAAGITTDTPDPQHGIIERDATGTPSGTLREAAVELVQAVVPPVDIAERLAGGRAGLAVANRYGITSIIDASADAETLAIWRHLAAANELTARIVASVSTAGGLESALALADPASRGTDALVRSDAAKVFIDGVLEGETAALLAPYASGGTGELLRSQAELDRLVAGLDAAGLQVHMHAIGDRAVRAGLDAIAAARGGNGPRDNRHHIAHLQLIDAVDLPRFGLLDVSANFQAFWAYPDEYITDVNLPAVGQARVDRMYPIASLARAGGRIVLGSDWPVSTMNPLPAIEAAVTRQDPAGVGADDPVLNAAERITLAQALAGHTRDAAWLLHQLDRVGTLEVGKRADLVVLGQDLFNVAPRQIGEVPVTLTLFEGRVVFAEGEHARTL